MSDGFYKGEVKDGKWHGLGFFKKSPKMLFGEFNDGKLNGYCVKICVS